MKFAITNEAFACIPTWEEILEVEYVRDRGEINMLTGGLLTYCHNRGLTNAVAWLERCKEAKVFWGTYFSQKFIETLEKEHGPKDGWITDEIRYRFLDLEYRIEEVLLEGKRRELTHRRRKLKKET